AGPGNGFIDVFSTDGVMQQRLVSHGALNSPWGLALAPSNFGDFSGDLLVGNFGDGRINVFNPTSGQFLGALGANGQLLVIHGLGGRASATGTPAGDANTLFYTAGPSHESHGLVGMITANAAGSMPVTATLNGSDLIINGGRDNDNVTVTPDNTQANVVVRA